MHAMAKINGIHLYVLFPLFVCHSVVAQIKIMICIKIALYQSSRSRFVLFILEMNVCFLFFKIQNTMYIVTYKYDI